jgi:hypothetical protein
MGYHDTHCSVIDIKGNEWNKLLEFVDGRVIDMDKGVFVNTLRLDDLDVNESDCREFFELAVRDTVQVFKRVINLQESEGNIKDLEDILTAGVMKMYSKRDINPDNYKSFKNTYDMHYSEIIDILESLTASASYTDAQKNICAIAKTRCAAFFLSESGKGSSMTKEITVQDVLNSPLTIYAFNKNSNSNLDMLDSLRVLMVQTLDNRVAMIRKKAGLFTAAFYEELQRCVNSVELIQYISSRVTGSRSDNLIIFLILNSISAFEEHALAQIRSNITSYFIGKVKTHEIDKIATSFDCASIKDYIVLINEQTTEFYRNCFAVKFDTGYKVDNCIIKAVVPEEVSKKFRTREILND